MKSRILAAGALLAATTFAVEAHSTVVPFHISGGGFSGSMLLTIAPDVSPPDPNPACGTPGNNPCRADPPGAYAISNVTGTFSDAIDGISNAAITGLVPIAPANERDPTFDPLVPSSLSFIDYTGGYLSYNNLFFPNGSPIDCDFPFAGTYLDVFGVAFTVAGGYTAVVWGDGNLDFGPLTYGVGVVQGNTPLAYQFAGVNGAIPEPSTWMFMLLGLGGLGYALRRERRQAKLA